MINPRLNMFIEFFNKQGIKFVDNETGEEIRPVKFSSKICPICENEIPEKDTKCMWCQNNVGEKDASSM